MNNKYFYYNKYSELPKLKSLLSSFIKIKGTVQQPQIAIDDKQALGAIVGIAATGGTAYLGSKLVMEPDASPCYTALIGTPYVSMFPKPTGVVATTKDVYNGAKEDIKNSELITKYFFKERSLINKFLQTIIRLLAPLL